MSAVPIPFFILLSFAAGAACAIAARNEVRSSPLPVLLTRGLQAFLVFAVLVLVPASAYFYIFHGDWSVLYWVDTHTIPSAVALLFFLVEILAGSLGYFLAGLAVRNHQDPQAYGYCALGLVSAGFLFLVYQSRLAKVGSYAQFHGDFGLTDYMGTPLMNGSIAMGILLVAGLSMLLFQLYWAARPDS